jgi:hypothetical protein
MHTFTINDIVFDTITTNEAELSELTKQSTIMSWYDTVNHLFYIKVGNDIIRLTQDTLMMIYCLDQEKTEKRLDAIEQYLKDNKPVIDEYAN